MARYMDVEEARKRLVKATADLFNICIEKITERYFSLPNGDERQGILDGLEYLLKHPTKRRVFVIDPNMARETRQRNSLTQKELAELLGFGERGQSLISKYEMQGIKRVMSPEAKEYAKWLREHGYED